MKKKMEKRLLKIDEARLCKVWRERKLNFEKAIEHEKQQQCRIRRTQAKLETEKKEQQKLVERLSVSHQLLTNDIYDEVKGQCHEEGSLLLPSVPKEREHVSVGAASHLDLITAKAAISHLEKEKHSALMTARHYRDLAEKLQTTNRHLNAKLHDSVEAVRNFWRNNIKEEQNRSGRMVMASLRTLIQN